MSAFRITRLPELLVGPGSLESATSLAGRFGKKLLLVTGKQSFRASSHYTRLIASFREEKIEFRESFIPGEPSPSLINAIVEEHRSFLPGLVMAIGGGSTLDAGKALSAMLPSGKDVRLFLEGVGSEIHNGQKLPFIAVPTTAGTGSEATKNAVLSEIGLHGFKRSLRHDNFIPEIAILDPLLAISCPNEVTLASGLDALTQLMEAYLSTRATPFTDALALPAINSIVKFLPRVMLCPTDIGARQELSYAAYISGICLANAGLGTVHGFASVIGAMTQIPHGIVCGLLMTPCHLASYTKLRSNGEADPVLGKFEKLSAVFNEGPPGKSSGKEFNDSFSAWTSRFHLPPLSSFGIQPGMIREIVSRTDQKNNPVILNQEDLQSIVLSCL
ncbi:MAG: iron-containing alcohol dehydrogenase [Bacteroidales bacterium]